MSVKDMIHQGRKALQYLEHIEEQAARIIDLVQYNQDFFGGIDFFGALKPGDDALTHAADKLEELIEEWRRE